MNTSNGKDRSESVAAESANRNTPSESAELYSLLAQIIPADILSAFGEDVGEALKALQESWQSHTQEFGELLEELSDVTRDAFNALTSMTDTEVDAEVDGAQWFSHFRSLQEHHLAELIDRAPGLGERHRRLLKFVHRQFLSALDITNWPSGNPEISAKVKATSGRNLSDGFECLLQDVQSAPDFHIKRCEESSFQIGDNIASTEGTVVYQNEIMQLIHYRPVKESVSATPLLMVPPCINKYYILDVSEENSVVRWLLEQGVDLYMISWVNPEKEHADLGIEAYLEQGVIAAKQYILRRSEAEKIHLAGYCIGGLFAALMASRDQASETIASLTLINTMLDYRMLGELGVFLSERMILASTAKAERESVLKGNFVSWAFTLLREQQLLWPYWIKRYFLNESLPADPVMYWNQDVSNLSARMAADYLDNFYLHNRYWEESLSLMSENLSISAIDVPTYVLACSKDHIVNWQASMQSACKINGKVRAVLAEGGHVMGVLRGINKKAPGRYWVMDPSLSAEKMQFDQSLGKTGLWWADWEKWLQGIDGVFKKPANWEATICDSIEPAPGSYVLARA